MRSHEAKLCEVHAYQGLDSLSEIQLHPLLAQSFTNSPLMPHREIGYPSSPKSRPNQTERKRCDLVLISDQYKGLFDPIDEQRQQDRAIGTLFESFATQHEPDPQDALPQDAYWIEVKAVAQYSYVDGVPGPNHKYASDLLQGPKTDVIKLASEPQIRYGAALVILFSEEEDTGIHDITASAKAMIDQDLPISVPEFESFPITNHAGNAWCTLGLIPVKF